MKVILFRTFLILSHILPFMTAVLTLDNIFCLNASPGNTEQRTRIECVSKWIVKCLKEV